MTILFSILALGLLLVAGLFIWAAAEFSYRIRETEAMRQYREAIDYLRRTSKSNRQPSR
jgi:hypothetical protein